MHIYLLRHAEDRLSYDEPHRDALTDRGRDQARAAGLWLAGQEPAELRTSLLGRARQTAAIVAGATGLAVRPDERLNEIVWESPTGEKLPHPREDRTYPTPPGSESWQVFMTRVASCISELSRNGREDRKVVLVTHSGFFDAVNELLCGGEGRVELAVAHAGITHWQHRPGCTGGAWLLHQHNVQPGVPA